jgi:Transposase C of IS166 homeodomain
MDSPRTDLSHLPDDAATLHALVLATLAERDALVMERDLLLAQNDRLRHLLLKLTRMQFGAKSERLPEEQLQLGLEALEQAIAKEDAQAEKQDPTLRKDNASKRRWRSAGATCGGVSMIWPKQRHRSQPKPCNASARSTRSRRASAARPQPSDWQHVRPRVSRWLMH